MMPAAAPIEFTDFSCKVVSACLKSVDGFVVRPTCTRKAANTFSSWDPFALWHAAQPKTVLSPRWPVASHVALAKWAIAAAGIWNFSGCLDKIPRAMHHVHAALGHFALW
jgi:hypothetical protein